MSKLSRLPVSERPRERLMREGADALSTIELIAIILGSGTKERSVLDLSQEVLVHFGSLDRLFDASVAELMAIKGIGAAKALQLKAAFGLATRSDRADPLKIEKPIHAYLLAKDEIARCKQEVLLVLLRDVRGGLIQKEKVGVGTLSQVLVHPREVFYPAVRHKAHSLILAHNHPSGDPTPSSADLSLTKALLNASQIMGIGLDDHLIVCVDQYVSMKERGILPHTGRY